MYNKLNIIKEKLAVDLLNKFGPAIKDDVFSLIESLAGKDSYVDNNLIINLQNILPLSMKDAQFFINLARELSCASAFAPVLLLEKIPTLHFYGVHHGVCQLLTNIKNYGARAVALFLGSDLLKTEDLIDVLEQADISYYEMLLSIVNRRHDELEIACSFVMRNAAKIEKAIARNDINAYLDICLNLKNTYGARLVEQYIQNTHEFSRYIPLEKHLSAINDWAEQSVHAAEFIIKYPQLGLPQLVDFKNDATNNKLFKIEILKKENYLDALQNAFLFNDGDFSTLLLAWPTASAQLKKNVLFQLEKDSYKNYILTCPEIENERNKVSEVTNSNWLKSWMFCGEIVDLLFIRKCIGRLLQVKDKFSLEAKSIVKKHAELFNRSQPEYSSERILGMIDVLLTYCKDPIIKNELCLMAEFIVGQQDGFKNLLSQTTLVIKTWERDPWVDYGKSDELYSCTSFGDYNAANAPGFLADLNINHLDIWSAGSLIGRIHLCLIKDLADNTLLLLDCVDGSERMITSKKKFEFIMSAILAYAHWLGIKQVKINYDVDYNMTPKKFIAHIAKSRLLTEKLDFFYRFLDVSTTRKLLPFPCQTFLESFVKNNGAFIRGPIIHLDQLRNYD